MQPPIPSTPHTFIVTVEIYDDKESIVPAIANRLGEGIQWMDGVEHYDIEYLGKAIPPCQDGVLGKTLKYLQVLNK